MTDIACVPKDFGTFDEESYRVSLEKQATGIVEEAFSELQLSPVHASGKVFVDSFNQIYVTVCLGDNCRHLASVDNEAVIKVMVSSQEASEKDLQEFVGILKSTVGLDSQDCLMIQSTIVPFAEPNESALDQKAYSCCKVMFSYNEEDLSQRSNNSLEE